MKKEEANDVVQYIIPVLDGLGVPRENYKIDVTTEKTGNRRGDVWVSKHSQKGTEFEKSLIALIEAKHKNTVIGDIEWREAMKHGREKARTQGLNYYIVTNCRSETRYYNAFNDTEISLDDSYITQLVPMEVMEKIQTQVSESKSQVIHKAESLRTTVAEKDFRTTLKNIADIYRSAGLRKGDERIDPTVSFVVIKYISEKEAERRTLPTPIRLWDSWYTVASEEEDRDLRAEFVTMQSQIWGENSQYKNNEYSDFKHLIDFPLKLKNEHFKKIYKELNKYHLHGAGFDLFGAIYEEFASQTKKKEFGEFYTRRHITGIVAKLLLRNEQTPRSIKICDPACGSGGFLTEAFTSLKTNYESNDKLTKDIEGQLRNDTFWGYDNDDKSVARTKLNMFLVGDGHTNIHDNDSLIDWDPKLGYSPSAYDYVLANPPMGQYEGEAPIEQFDFTNESRYELLFTEKIVEMLKPGGEMAIVLNDGALEATTRENFRRKLLEHCNIHAIVSLTKFAFAPYTKEKTYVLFMQKKPLNLVGQIQDFPIWAYIVDYDGYANSDKRYMTKYHDDLPELQKLFEDALKTATLGDRGEFEEKRGEFERTVNEQERSEELTGRKCGFISMDEINSNNFHNLLCEFYLRPVEAAKVSPEKYDTILKDLAMEISGVSDEVKKLVDNL